MSLLPFANRPDLLTEKADIFQQLRNLSNAGWLAGFDRHRPWGVVGSAIEVPE